MATNEEARAALVAALSEMTEPALDAKGEAGGGARYAYTTLSGLLNHARPVLARHGLALYLSTECMVGGDGVGTATATARIVHAGGEVATSSATMPVLAMVRRDGSVVAPNSQAYGGALTYARRYAAYGVLGIGGETDSDGAAIRDAEARGKAIAEAPKPAPQPTQAASAPRANGDAEAPADGISDAQRKAVFATVRAKLTTAEHTPEADEVRAQCTAVAQSMFQKTVSELTKKQASAMLDWLKTCTIEQLTADLPF